jgi:hypothetical protein
MFDIVAANDNKLASPVESEGLQNTKAPGARYPYPAPEWAARRSAPPRRAIAAAAYASVSLWKNASLTAISPSNDLKTAMFAYPGASDIGSMR